MTAVLGEKKRIDVIFAMDDLTAKGVYHAYQKSGISQPFTIGVDALAGEGGEKVLEVAHQILTGKPFERNNILYTGIVDKSNAQLIKKQREEFFSQREKTDRINHTLDQTRDEHFKQRITFFISILIAASIILLIIRAYRSKSKSGKKLEEEYRKIERENEDIQKQADILLQQKQLLEILSPTPEQMPDTEQEYINRIQSYILENITDPSLNVETIAKTFGESYTNMYRKIKSYTGQTPGELINKSF